MVTKKDIEKLAELARIELPEEEYVTLTKDFDAILSYVSEVREVSAEATVDAPEAGKIYNVMRDDVPYTHEGECTTEILEEVPEKQGGYVKVEKIL